MFAEDAIILSATERLQKGALQWLSDFKSSDSFVLFSCIYRLTFIQQHVSIKANCRQRRLHDIMWINKALMRDGFIVSPNNFCLGLRGRQRVGHRSL